MTRKIYLVSDYNTENDSYSIDRAFTSYESALRYFKSRIAEVLIFYKLSDLHFDEIPINTEKIFDKESIFALYNGGNNEIHDLPNTKESFGKDCLFEVKFMCDTDTFVLKEIEEES